MFFLGFFLVFPLVYVATLEPYWQRRVLGTVILLYLLWVATRLLRHLVSAPGKPKQMLISWPVAQEAGDFQGRFISAMQAARCRVTWSKIVDSQRVGFAIQRGRLVVVALCLAPNARLREWDLAQLGQWARTEHAQARAVVSRPKDRPEVAEEGLALLSYQELGDEVCLGALFGGARGEELGGMSHSPQTPRLS